jgi:teichuronic acid biosynthesis glycosyltransferase TuaC
VVEEASEAMNDSLHVLVVSFLYPSDVQPLGGVFIRERLVRLSSHLKLTVVSPQPWSPIDWLIRRFVNSHYRKQPQKRVTNEDGFYVYRPRFFSIPGVGRTLDAYSIALSIIVWAKVNRFDKTFSSVDAHFVVPEGYASKLVAGYLKVPFGITLRGARDTDCVGTALEPQLKSALKSADYTIGVSESLQRFATKMGANPNAAIAIPNGVNQNNFFQEDKIAARKKLGLPHDAKIIVSVGSLIPLKGHARVVSILPELLKIYPNLILLIVGGPTAFGDTTSEILNEIASKSLEPNVRLVGKVVPSDLRWYLSCADVFALATANEGWPNALMEAIACGLPIVTTDVGGNSEIVHNPQFGSVVKFWDPESFSRALLALLDTDDGHEARAAWIKTRTWDAVGNDVAKVILRAVTNK